MHTRDRKAPCDYHGAIKLIQKCQKVWIVKDRKAAQCCTHHYKVGLE